MAKGKNKNQGTTKSGSANRNALAAKLESALIDQLRPGRHLCKCQARIHALIRNCMGCGRIVCKQEGSGPCFSCGTLVCTREEREVLDRGSRASNELYKKLMGTDAEGKDLCLSSFGSDFAKAAEFTNKLLEADADSERKTKVNDLQCDYSSIEKSAFLSAEERDRIKQRRDELINMRNKERRNIVVNLDISNLTLEEKKKEYNSININTDPVIQNILQKSDARRQAAESMHSSALDSKWVPEGFVPKYDKINGQEFPANMHILRNVNVNGLIESEISSFEVDNKGYVVVLSQPLATLVAHGVIQIFRFSQNVQIKGPVFIASDNRSCTVDELDATIKTHFSGRRVPEFSPCCILGRIFIDESYSMKEYQSIEKNAVVPGDGNFVLATSASDPFVGYVEHVSLSQFYQVDEQLRKILNCSYNV